MSKPELGLIGAGQMAEAILRGAIQAKVLIPESVLASDRLEERRGRFASLGARVTADNLEVVRECGAILVAVKPQDLDALLRQVGPSLSGGHLVISICAGCATSLFEAAAAGPVRVVRAMPNLPARVRLGATALCPGRHATQADLGFARRLFDAVGATVIVEEGTMDAVTALSGSGPAYFFLLVELMIEAGRQEGLPEDVALRLAIQTARGAAEMMAAGEASPAELRRRVTSKGGTTEAALRHLEASSVPQAIVKAVRAAAARSRELGGK